MAKKQDALEERTRTIYDAVKVDPLALEQEFAALPADLVHFGDIYASAMRRKLVSKHELDREEARLYIEKREAAEEDGKKPTEATIRSAVLNSEEYNDAKLAAIDAEVDAARASNRLQALAAKKDALVSLGANLRAEMSGNPSLRTQSRGARDVEATRYVDDDED